jgi:hypothetical protein
MRTKAQLLCLALAGCAGADAGPEITASTPAAAPSGRNAQASAKKEDWWTKGGATRPKLSAMCWMKYEKGRNDLPIDKRADLVNACIDEAMAKYQVR